MEAILEWQSACKSDGTRIDWKEVAKIIMRKHPELATDGKKGRSVNEWRDLWASIAKGNDPIPSEEKKPASSSSSSESSVAAADMDRDSRKRKLVEGGDDKESLNCQNILPSKIYNDLMNSGNEVRSVVSSRSDRIGVHDMRKRIRDKYCDSQPIMHRYDPSVSMIFSPTVMTDVYDSVVNNARIKVGLSSRTVALNPMTAKSVLRINQAVIR